MHTNSVLVLGCGFIVMSWKMWFAVLLLFQILKFMHAQSTYFHQGYDLMNDLDQYMKNVSSEVRKLWTVNPNCETQEHENDKVIQTQLTWKLWLLVMSKPQGWEYSSCSRLTVLQWI